ncbi:DUF4279 domain-containing protein [Paenibacillus fonticola]|uniref:DUF4279 domain-containing protein n=1 Tax=Paenibacillus fonticola TaxID=379896 RepID=UPI000366993F|nr:DUF4279 domain-containing protein [Paenibacillus fonticola]
MNLKGNCTISFIDSSLTMDELHNILKITPTKIIKKGQVISEAINKSADSNKWMYKEVLNEGEEPSEVITRLLNQLKTENIQRIIQTCNDAVIGLYLNSEYGQMGFELSAENIARLSELKIRFEVHILSLGKVD